MKILVFFGGTLETGIEQIGRFVRSVPADHYVLVRGLGAATITDAELPKALGYQAVSALEGAFNLPEGQIAVEKIHLIEKYYKGTRGGGFDKTDLEQIATAVSVCLHEILEKNEEKVQFVFAGWSRGAAVALASFASALARREEFSHGILKNRGVTSAAFMFIDPVAGQTGNSYPFWMDKDWSTNDLYKNLTNEFKQVCDRSSLRIYEFWSIAGGLNWALNANPARRFMCSSPQNVDLKRFAIGERHGSGVDATVGNDLDFKNISNLMIAWLDPALDPKEDRSGVLALAEEALEKRSVEQRKQVGAGGKSNRLNQKYDDIKGNKFAFTDLWPKK